MSLSLLLLRGALQEDLFLGLVHVLICHLGWLRSGHTLGGLLLSTVTIPYRLGLHDLFFVVVVSLEELLHFVLLELLLVLLHQVSILPFDIIHMLCVEILLRCIWDELRPQLLGL